MFKDARRVMAAGITVALMVGLLGSAPVLGQADEVSPAAGVNADTVDGKDAVAATKSATKRAHNLVAANRLGKLPSNILDPLWSLLQGMSAGFVDGVDDGITAMTFTQVVGTAVVLAAGGTGTATATCPAGSVPISGGHTASSFLVFNVSSFRTGAGWIVAATNTDGVAQTLTPIVHCVATIPSTAISSISIAKESAVKSANSNKPPSPKKRQ